MTAQTITDLDDLDDKQPDQHEWADWLVPAAEVLITLGVVIGLFLVHHTVATTWDTRADQRAAADELTARWNAGDEADDTETGQPVPGDATGFIRIPRFGDDWQYTFFTGVDQKTLAKGPGMYPLAIGEDDDAQNLALAGHRDGWDAPFGQLDTLTTCDEITVELADQIVHYRVLPTTPATGETGPADREQEITHGGCFDESTARTLTDNDAYRELTGTSVVDPSQTNVVNPVPGRDDTPSQTSLDGDGLSLLTLTTCHPHWSNAQRLIVHAVATQVTDKTH